MLAGAPAQSGLKSDVGLLCCDQFKRAISRFIVDIRDGLITVSSRRQDDVLVLYDVEGSLPPLEIHCSLRVIKSPRLEGFSASLYVAGDFSMEDCNLHSLAATTIIGGDMSVVSCYKLERLSSESLDVRGSLTLLDLRNLKSLPVGLEVHGDMRCNLCPNLQDIPDGLVVGSHLSIEEHDKAHLQSIDQDFASSPDPVPVPRTSVPRVGGSLQFAAVEMDRISLGNRMVIHGSLKVRSLKHDKINTILPRRSLKVLGNATLIGSGTLTLPGQFSVHGAELCLEGLLVQAWPSSLLFREGDEPLRVLMLGQVVDLMMMLDNVQGQSQNQSQSQINLSGPAERNRQERDVWKLSEAVEFWDPGSQCDFESAIDRAYHYSVALFLQKLSASKEYAVVLRQSIDARVRNVLRIIASQQLAEMEELRATVLEMMVAGGDACSDKPVLTLNMIDVLLNIFEAKHDAVALRKVGRSVMHLEIVHRHVLRKIECDDVDDHVCVYLRFEIALRDPLGLPINASAMKYPNYVAVSEAEINAAKEEALSVTDEQFEVWLAHWPEWQRLHRWQVAESILYARSPPTWLPVIRKLASTEEWQVRMGNETWKLRDVLNYWVRTGRSMSGCEETSVEGLLQGAKLVVPCPRFSRRCTVM
mmetsp:Transcript_7484/g.13728  ORF Transcript_7484/g.13728 Transcript_7484/m.13728 type:complete len:644 (+) Transcript_7484:192-2123(+)